jgi:hypothetical protein
VLVEGAACTGSAVLGAGSAVLDAGSAALGEDRSGVLMEADVPDRVSRV